MSSGVIKMWRWRYYWPCPLFSRRKDRWGWNPKNNRYHRNEQSIIKTAIAKTTIGERPKPMTIICKRTKDQIKVPKQVLVDLKRRRLSHISSTKGLGWLCMVCIWIIQESGECVAWIITSSPSAHQLDVLLPHSLPSPTNQNPQHFIQPNHLGIQSFSVEWFWNWKFSSNNFKKFCVSSVQPWKSTWQRRSTMTLGFKV